MGHLIRMQLVARITYYVGWIALACGALVHVNVARGLFANLAMSQRNLFEVSVVCFLICAASELRALATSEKEATGVVKKPMAA